MYLRSRYLQPLFYVRVDISPEFYASETFKITTKLIRKTHFLFVSDQLELNYRQKKGNQVRSLSVIWFKREFILNRVNGSLPGSFTTTFLCN